MRLSALVFCMLTVAPAMAQDSYPNHPVKILVPYGPGGATDTISSFIYREYRDRSNVGYATMVAEVYLVIIIIFVTLLLKMVNRFMQKMT